MVAPYEVSAFAGNPALQDHWYAVARSTEIAPGPRAVALLGRDYVLWRGGAGEIVAAPDRCPHRESPLSPGIVDEHGCIECPYHGWRFGSGGTCVAVPSNPAGVPVPPKAHLATVHVAERYGLVWICPGEPISGVPEIAEDDDPAFRRINNPVEEWKASATRMVDNFLDISHFPFVHTGTFGRAQSTAVPKIDNGPLDEDFFGYAYEVDVNNAGAGTITSGQTAKVLTRRMTSGFSLPLTCRSTIEYETGLRHVLLLLSTPIDDGHSYFTFVVWRNDDFSVSAEDVIQFDRAIGAEDKRMLERVPGVLSFDQRETVSVQADRCSRRVAPAVRRPVERGRHASRSGRRSAARRTVGLRGHLQTRQLAGECRSGPAVGFHHPQQPSATGERHGSSTGIRCEQAGAEIDHGRQVARRADATRAERSGGGGPHTVAQHGDALPVDHERRGEIDLGDRLTTATEQQLVDPQQLGRRVELHADVGPVPAPGTGDERLRPPHQPGLGAVPHVDREPGAAAARAGERQHGGRRSDQEGRTRLQHQLDAELVALEDRAGRRDHDQLGAVLAENDLGRHRGFAAQLDQLPGRHHDPQPGPQR